MSTLDVLTFDPRTFDPDQAWTAVLARDSGADSRFVYAVETTGIFCRPSCPSRRPARRHVRFFSGHTDAIAAGYRACRRCHPAGRHAEAEAVARLCGYLETNLDRMVTLKELGLHAGLSPFTIQRMFERVLGVSPRHYQIELRAQRLREGLANNVTVTDAIYDAGFASLSRMYEGSERMLGMQPAKYKASGAGETIEYATAACALGTLLVATTARGVCYIALGGDAASLETELRARFAQAAITPQTANESSANGSGGTLHLAVAQILSTLTEHPASFDLPLDIRATAFQQRVWKALQGIPRGETRSYSQVANELGHPRAVRAVAQACARNPLALVVPCHRVIGRDGAITGYRWGTERKQKLLELEARKSSPANGN